MTFALNYTTAWERFLEWYRGSWADRAFTFLGERVFVVAFGEYEKIPLPANAGEIARGWILAFLVAFWIAAFTMAFVKAVPGGFVRRLLALGAVDEEHAVTLAEAGYARSAAIRSDLSRGGALAKLLCRPGNAEKTVAGTLVPDLETEVDPQTGAARPSLLERLAEPEKPAPSAAEQPETAPETNGAPAATDQPTAEKPTDPAPLNLAADRFYIPKALRARAELRFANRGSGFLFAALSIPVSALIAFLLCGLLPILFGFANRILSAMS